MQPQITYGKEIVSIIIELQKNMHTFYQDSFNNLIWAFGIGLAIVGGIIPYILNRNQNKEFDRKYKDIEDKLVYANDEMKKKYDNKIRDLDITIDTQNGQLKMYNELIDKQKNEQIILINDLKKIIDDQKAQIQKQNELLENHKRETRREFQRQKAHMYYDKSVLYIDIKKYDTALSWFLSAIGEFIDLDEEFMVELTMRYITDHCMANIDRDDLDYVFEDLKKLHDILKDKNHEKYIKDLKSYEIAIEKMKVRLDAKEIVI